MKCARRRVVGGKPASADVSPRPSGMNPGMDEKRDLSPRERPGDGPNTPRVFGRLLVWPHRRESFALIPARSHSGWERESNLCRSRSAEIRRLGHSLRRGHAQQRRPRSRAAAEKRSDLRRAQYCERPPTGRETGWDPDGRRLGGSRKSGFGQSGGFMWGG